MIVTLTPNTAVDCIIVLEDLSLAETRARYSKFEPGGSGVHVSRVINEIGGTSVAIGFSGGETGSILKRRCESLSIASAFIPIAGETRINHVIIEKAKGRQIEISGSGPRIEHDELDELRGRFERLIAGASMAVLSGSLPPDVPTDFYTTLLRIAWKRRIPVTVDFAGDPLAIIDLAKPPTFIKLNQGEVAEWLGLETGSFTSIQLIVENVRSRMGQGDWHVILTMGDKGASLITADEGFHASVRKRPEVAYWSGSGDAFIAGFTAAYTRSGDAVDALRDGVAAGTANVSHIEAGRCTRQQLSQIGRKVRIQSLQQLEKEEVVL